MNKNIQTGLAWIIAGVLITVVIKYIMEQIALATGASYYIYLVAIGPIVYGGVRILAGVEEIIKPEKNDDSKGVNRSPYDYLREVGKEECEKKSLPLELLNRKRFIAIRVCFYVIALLIALALLTMYITLLFMAIIPLVWAIIKYAAIVEDIKIEKKMQAYRKKMDEEQKIDSN